MGERGRVVWHVLWRSAESFLWTNSAGGEHFKKLGTAWKKINPALDLRPNCFPKKVVVNKKGVNYE
jgi:hypothetical protein